MHTCGYSGIRTQRLTDDEKRGICIKRMTIAEIVRDSLYERQLMEREHGAAASATHRRALYLD